MHLKQAKRLYTIARNQAENEQFDAAMKQIYNTAQCGQNTTYFYETLSQKDVNRLKKEGFKVEYVEAREKTIGTTTYSYPKHHIISGWGKK